MHTLSHVSGPTDVIDETDADSLVIPVVAEEVQISRRIVDREHVHFRTRVSERAEIVDVPLVEEEIRVERVEVGRFVEAAAAPRQEGDTLIVPVYEEVAVVEKRLFLREELRVTKVRHEHHETRRVVLQREDVDVDRSAPPSAR